MENQLKDVLCNVNEWLKFAESKNAGLLVADSAMIFGIFSIINSYGNIPQYVIYYFYFSLLLLLLSAILCLISFVPKTRIPPRLFSREKPKKNDNLIFYSHIAKYDSESYLENFIKYCGDKDDIEVSLLSKAYINQIVINSSIALQKYRIFDIAIWLTLFALSTPFVGMLVFLLKDNE